MTHVDSSTRDFMDAVAGKPTAAGVTHSTDDTPKPAEKQVETVLRTARSVLRNPQKYVARKIVATALVGNEGSEKIASAANDANAVGLFHALTDRYGRDWHDWEPETLWHALTDLLGSGEPPRNVKDMVLALQVAVNTNAPFEHWHVFENVANAFAGNPVDFGVLQPIELTDAARAIRILLELRPKMIFDDEVWGYIAALAKQSGVVCLPAQLFGGSTTPQATLDTLNNDIELRAQVQKRWPGSPKADDTLALKIQLLRLKEIDEAAHA